MAITKADLVITGFDPAALDNILNDFGTDAALVFQMMADFQAKGFGIAWIIDLVQTMGPAVLKFAEDLMALLGAAHPAVAAKMMAHPTVKMSPTLAARPFLDWVMANLPQLLALILKFLPILKPTPAGPTPVLP